MKRALALAALVLSMSGCRYQTEYGQCVGLASTPDPALVYRPSTRNLVLAAIFVETIFVPVLVALNQYSCPVAHTRPLP